MQHLAAKPGTCQAVIYSSSLASLGVVAPLVAPAGQEAGVLGAALTALVAVVGRQLPAGAGLNSAAFRRRHVRIPRGAGGGFCHAKPVSAERAVDGDVLAAAAHLLTRRQVEDIAQGMGRSRDDVMGMLQHAWMLTRSR